MTDKQEMRVRSKAYKYYDEVIYENQDWSMRDIALSSFYAGAEYALKNKYDELRNGRPNIVQFLKDNGVYEVFFENLFKQKQGRDLSDYFLFGFSNYNAISSAFTWSNTPEGHTFWSEISEEFNKQF